LLAPDHVSDLPIGEFAQERNLIGIPFSGRDISESGDLSPDPLALTDDVVRRNSRATFSSVIVPRRATSDGFQCLTNRKAGMWKARRCRKPAGDGGAGGAASS
jgi:hypothetical protein